MNLSDKGIFFMYRRRVSSAFFAVALAVVFVAGVLVGARADTAVVADGVGGPVSVDCTRRVYTYPPKPLECP